MRINVKMPNVNCLQAGFKFKLSRVEDKKVILPTCWQSYIYRPDKFHELLELSMKKLYNPRACFLNYGFVEFGGQSGIISIGVHFWSCLSANIGHNI